MYRFIVNILLVICMGGSISAKQMDLEILDHIDLKSFLCVTINGSDTIWSLRFRDRDLSEGMILLIKTTDKKVLGLMPSHHYEACVTDSLTTIPFTGETVRHYHYDHILEYDITTTALNYFVNHNIIKLRIGTEKHWQEKVWRRNEWGKSLVKAYKELKKRISPDYVPPKKPTIYDGF